MRGLANVLSIIATLFGVVLFTRFICILLNQYYHLNIVYKDLIYNDYLMYTLMISMVLCIIIEEYIRHHFLNEGENKN
ncbi:hypothetical protein [Staphylococcus caprae]|uniref:Uncharacterized protein n=1 Tax=Staphylococcus caprae TaxID=29380 RepID=A0ABM7FUN9_9STAP|nr:hypothetical protein [Staphylococcus caprae]EES41821.1 hypothetical protein HMPREF0793_0550 [Staphylococcus caprae M23864:W1]PAK64749.1 hypothetical protein B9K00_05495 [Staphylococcus caprae]QDW93144.1 hypothetical protein DWB96_02460 [Staphylococcus caprae]QJE26201.1 hypothetical protein HHJ99_10980 [Staphylococcus caprae]RIM34015.1 hypothetical protein BU631_08245 [Staphylococcus caprae]